VIRFVAARLVHAVLVVLAVATLTFILLHAAPGDPVAALAEQRIAGETAARMRRVFRLDEPVPVQYAAYLGNLLRGELGSSFRTGRPVWHELRDRIPATLILAFAALMIDFTLGIGLGVLQARHAGRPLDRALSLATLTVYALPLFWLGMLLQGVFALQLRWFPMMGMVDAGLAPAMSPLGRVADLLRHLALPAVTLGLVGAASTARYQRAELLEVIRQDYLRAARARGLAERTVWLGHALRNALLSAITLFGLSLPLLLSGAVIIETVFAWPGMGRLSLGAIFDRDYNVAVGAALVAAVMVVAGNLLADVACRLADPRTRGVA
jgi:peptide/nickel transport system permease protein